MAKAKSKSASKPKTKSKQGGAKLAKPNANDDRWWALIDHSRKGTEDPEEHMEQLHELLVELPEADIIDFDRFVQERIRDAFRSDLWGIAYIMNGGCSDDGFDYFCGWLVSKGKQHYEAALAKPEDAAKGVSPDDEPFECEDMFYVASRAWEEKTGKSVDDFQQVAVQVTRSLQGELFDEETIDEQYPKLAKKFGGG